MITQILNIFDPGTSDTLKFNWLFLFMPFFCPLLVKNYLFFNKSMIYKMMINQLTMAFFPLSKFTSPFMFTCFSILSWNMMGLMPFNFTITTQFMVTISLALPLWSTPFINSLMTKYWWPSHLTPSNLPALALAMFMSFMELMSCFLRPMTLSLRLMMNLTAGHLILSLVALAQNNSLNKIFFMMGLVMFGFMMLELAVAFMQSYVFSMLTLLYSKEN